MSGYTTHYVQLLYFQNELKCTDEYFEYVQPVNHRKELKETDCDDTEEEIPEDENEDYFRLAKYYLYI